MRVIRENVLEVQREPYSGLGASTAPSPLESRRVLEGMEVLDVGCGGGILSEVRLFLARFPCPTTRISPYKGGAHFFWYSSLIPHPSRVWRVSANMLAIDASAENISIATCHAESICRPGPRSAIVPTCVG